MKEPRILLTRIEKIFRVCCFVLAIYYITYFSTQYAENLDTTFISMKTFNEHPDDKYPTFTFCVKGHNFLWFEEDKIFDSFALDTAQYELMLKEGTALKDEFNKNSKVYEKRQVVFSDFTDTDFDEFHIKINDFLTELEYATERRMERISLNDTSGDMVHAEAHINISYKTADKICFSRSSDDKLTSMRLHDLITFNSSVLKKYHETEIQVFIHHPKQLIRSFDKPKYKASFEYLISTLGSNPVKGPKTLDFRISQVKQLRKRSTSVPPCNDDLLDYDQFYKESMISKLGCIPPYWMNEFSNKSKLGECASPKQLKDAYSKIKEQERIGDLNEIPCNEMILLSIDSVNNEPSPRPKDVSIKFIYTEKSYEEIRYNKMIGFDGWLSNVGGFVGIFVGYSMLQIPEILACIIGLLDGKNLKAFQSKYNRLILQLNDNRIQHYVKINDSII